MIPESKALARILAAVQPLSTEIIPVENAAGRRCPHDTRAETPLPRFDQSAMDGYAIRAIDADNRLTVVGEQPAGPARALTVGENEAVRIFTGGAVPPGATAVVMQEDVSREDDVIEIREKVAEGEFVRRAGGDIAAGQTAIEAGQEITSGGIGLLLATGHTSLEVHRRPRVRIITTGDELKPPGSPLAPGESIDSNGPMLAALLRHHAELEAPRHAPDAPGHLAALLEETPAPDVIVISGGVSVGDHDPVHEALAKIGAEIFFWKIDLKPGKPLLFARAGSAWIFGLPGNPVSSHVTATLFVVPALRRMLGAPAAQAGWPRLAIPVSAAIANPGTRPHYLRGTIADQKFHPAPVQQSHGLLALSRTDALARVPGGAILHPGDTVEAILPGFAGCPFL